MAEPDRPIVVMCERRGARDSACRCAAGGLRVDFEALEAAVGPRTRLLIYTSPSNPLGWVATVEEQQRLLEFARTTRPVADGR